MSLFCDAHAMGSARRCNEASDFAFAFACPWPLATEMCTDGGLTRDVGRRASAHSSSILALYNMRRCKKAKWG